MPSKRRRMVAVPVCDRCDKRAACYTVPLFDSRTRRRSRTEVWCHACHKRAFPTDDIETVWLPRKGGPEDWDWGGDS